MHPAGARVLREDDQQEMNREAVLLQWERKIEEAERRPNRFERAAEGGEEDVGAQPEGAPRSIARPAAPAPRSIARPAAPTEDATHEAPRRFEQSGAPRESTPGSERRTITITGHPTPARRRRRHSVVESQLAQPDRIALWAFLLGLFLIAVAAGTAHA